MYGQGALFGVLYNPHTGQVLASPISNRPYLLKEYS
jgi:hypothetical protein